VPVSVGTGVKDGPLGRQSFEMLMDNQFWPAEQLRTYQRSQLIQLLIHAKNNAPFYRTRQCPK
jgi:phenylacetate-coenzyme A ligase PaaK-like adenylate-forming protein